MCIRDSGRTVLTSDDEITDVLGAEVLHTVHEIVEFEALARNHPEAQTRAPALRMARGPLGGAQLAAATGVTRRAARGQLRAARELELPRRAEARVGKPLVLELLEKALVDAGALGLAVRLSLIHIWY